jgi:hypothetical protein
VSDKYELIDEEKETMTPGGQKKYTTAAMCGWLEISTAGYYEWREGRGYLCVRMELS